MEPKATTTEDALLMAYANFKLKNYERMLVFTKQALKLRSEFPLALHYKALALRGLGDLKGADIAIQTAIAKDKDNYYHKFLLGIVQWNSGDMEGAEENIRKAIRYIPNEPLYHIEYATFLIHRGRFDDALDAAYKAKRLNEDTPKLKEVIRSAKQKEFLEGIDDLVYEPPFPYNKETVFPYNKIGEYYLHNDYLSNSMDQFAKALHYDSKNLEARSGFATAVRLKEGGFYHFARNFAKFLIKPYIFLIIMGVIALMVYVAFKDPNFMMIPATSIAGGLIIMVIFFMIIGLSNKSPDEFNKILSEWEVEDIDALIKKMRKVVSQIDEMHLEQEAVQTRSQGLLNYSNFFALIFWVALISQVGLVNINLALLPVDVQDNVRSLRVGIMILLIFSIVMAVWLRTRSRAIIEDASVRFSKRK
ncbi:MAG: hypothetical protein K8T10_02710 [Candidatus Eremiobacteraeota bacterium]|nr:hypothetical protein [Candidatus Eremiobacteraeota bacterium]